MEHHIAATSGDTTDTDGAFRSLLVDRAEELHSPLLKMKTNPSPG